MSSILQSLTVLIYPSLLRNSNKISGQSSATSLHPPLIGRKSIGLAVRKLSQKDELFIQNTKHKRQFDIGKNK